MFLYLEIQSYFEINYKVMRKFYILIILFFLLVFNSQAQNSKSEKFNPGQIVNTTIFFHSGIFGDTAVHIIWDKYESDNIKTVTLEKSYDNNDFFPINQVEANFMVDLHAAGYPKNIARYNNIIYTTEHGNGRYIYNDLVTEEIKANLKWWYRIKMTSENGVIYYSQAIDNNEVYTNAHKREKTAELDKNIGKDGNNEMQLVKSACPSIAAPPSGYTSTGVTTTNYGQCCYWIETKYQTTTPLQTSCSGNSYAWCCNNVPPASSCSSGFISDDCCVHYCSDYNICGCTPWTVCCSNSTVIQWVVTQSVSYSPITLSSIVVNESCPGSANGVVNLNIGNSQAPITINWSNGAQTQQISNLTSGTYTVTITDAHNCTVTGSYFVNVNPNPTPNITGTLAFCQGQNTTLDAGGPFSSYLWSTGSSNQTINVSTSGIYSVTVTNSSGCSGSSSKTVTVYNLPSPSISPSGPTSFCNGGSVNLNAGAYSSFLWSTGANTQSITTGSTGTYAVTVTDANNCSNSTSIPVNVYNNPVPIITPNGPTAFCIGGSVNLTPGNYSGYLWSNGSVASNITVNSSGTYSVTITDASNCNGSANISVTVYPLPIPDAGQDVTICLGNTANLNAGGGISYQWSNSTTNNPNPVIPQTTTTYIVTVTDANTCSATDNVVVNIYPITSTFTVISPICMDNSTVVTYTGNGSSGATYNWNYNGGTPTSGSGPGPITVQYGTSGPQTITLTVQEPNCTLSVPISLSVTVYNILDSVVYNDVSCFSGNNGAINIIPSGGTGTYTYNWSTGANTSNVSNLAIGVYTVTVTDTLGCTESSSVTIGQAPILSATINDSIPVSCFQGSNGSAVVSGSGGTPAYTYNWSPLGGSGSTGTGLPTGIYTVTISDHFGCTATDKVYIGEPPLLVLAIDTTIQPLCYNGTDGSGTVVASGGVGNYSYLWNSFPTQATAHATGLHSGGYIVTVTDGNNCQAIVNVNIAQPNPIAINPIPQNEHCLNYCDGEILANVSGGTSPYTYKWNTSPLQTSNPAITLCVGEYHLTVTDAHNCTSTSSVNIFTNSLISASASANPILGILPLTVNFTFTGNGATQYFWEFGDGGTSNIQNPSHLYTTEGVYTVTLTINSGSPDFCQDVLTLTIEILKPSSVIIPNVFTPNNDGQNDYFYAKSEGLVLEEMIIYNRWGEKVYSWAEIGGKWDGVDANGRPASDGTYFYVFTGKGFDNVDYARNGSVTLIR